MGRKNSRSGEQRGPGLRIYTTQTYGLASSYDRVLHLVMSKIHEAYWEGRVWDLERAIYSLIAILPPRIKYRAKEYYYSRYKRYKETIQDKLRRSLLPGFYEYKEELLERLIDVYSYIMDLLDEAGISIFGKREGLELPEPEKVSF